MPSPHSSITSCKEFCFSMRLGRLDNAYPKNQPPNGGVPGVARGEVWEPGRLLACPYIRRNGWAKEGLRVSPGGGCAERRVQHRWPGLQGPVQDVDDRPGPAEKTHISAPPACPRPGKARAQACMDLVTKVGRDGAPRRQGWKRERPLFTVALAHRSSTMRSDRLPTSRSG